MKRNSGIYNQIFNENRPPSEERSPPLKLILIFLLLSSEMVFRIVIEDLFSWFDSGLGHLNFTKNLVLFLFTFQVKARKLFNFNNHAAFSRNHHYVVNNSGLILEDHAFHISIGGEGLCMIFLEYIIEFGAFQES